MIRIKSKIGLRGEITIPKVFMQKYKFKGGDILKIRDDGEKLIIFKNEQNNYLNYGGSRKFLSNMSMTKRGKINVVYDNINKKEKIIKK